MRKRFNLNVQNNENIKNGQDSGAHPPPFVSLAKTGNLGQNKVTRSAQTNKPMKKEKCGNSNVSTSAVKRGVSAFWLHNLLTNKMLFVH